MGRAVALRSLLKATEDGYLEDAVAQVTRAPPPPDKGEDDLEDLRNLARETLRSASFDGTLERALSTDLEEEAEDRRLRARRALENLVDSNGPDIVEALDTGSLAMALQVHERQ